MAGEGKEYVIGRGKLYFDKFLPNTKTQTGEAYFGNTPELSSTVDIETLDHYDADEGLNVKDESVTLENNLTLSFTTDNISIGNVALWYGGSASQQTVATGTALTYPIRSVFKGKFYQIGQTDQFPMGARKIDNVEINDITIPATPVVIAPEGNYEVDLDTGRLYIEMDAPDIDDSSEVNIEVTYDVDASTSVIIVGRGDEIRGSLRFLSANPVGAQRNYYWPYVKVTSNGDYALKGSEWQQMSFSAEVLKKDSATERLYIQAIED